MKPPENHKSIIDEISPVMLIGSTLISGLIFISVHLIYGPPLSLLAAGILTLITPPIAYGLQSTYTRRGEHANFSKALLYAGLSLYTGRRSASSASAHQAPAAQSQRRESAPTESLSAAPVQPEATRSTPVDPPHSPEDVR